MSEAQNLESLVAHIIEVAKNRGGRVSTVLDAMVILHVRLAHDLIDKGVFTPDEYVEHGNGCERGREEPRGEPCPVLSYRQVSHGARSDVRTAAID